MHRWADACFELDTTVLQRKLVPGAAQELSGEAVLRRVLLLPRLADPAAELVRVEMSISAIDHGRKRAVVEAQETGVGAFGVARRVPGAGRRAHALHAAAAEQPHDVDVMRGLVEYHATAALGRELLWPPRPVQEVREVERRDHSHFAHQALIDDLSCLKNRPVEAVAVADDQRHARLAGGVDHRPAVLQCERHRLLDQQMLAVRRSKTRLLGVELVRRRDVYDLDRRVLAELFYGRIALSLEV